MPAADGTMVDEPDLEACFASFRGCVAVALAVSGGPDSLALLMLAHRWRMARGSGPALTVLTVDHRLRRSSASEARAVADIAHRLGLAHHTLVWHGPKPTSGIEQAARNERYRLLVEAARSLGIQHILTGHHMDDQAETVLMRLGQGSGLTGLAAMRAARRLSDDVVLHRPLLGITKARLAEAATIGVVPVDDETNNDRRFARPRIRQVMCDLSQAGVPPSGMARSAARLARADEALEHYAEGLMRDAVSFDRFAIATLDRARLGEAPQETRLRVISRVLAAVSGVQWPPPKNEQLEEVCRATVSNDRFKRTLGGATIAAANNVVQFYRESGRKRLPKIEIKSGDSGIWDGRFAYRIGGNDGRMFLGPLGEAGRRKVGIRLPGVPTAAIAALPAFSDETELIAVPTLGLNFVDRADVTVSPVIGALLQR